MQYFSLCHYAPSLFMRKGTIYILVFLMAGIIFIAFLYRVLLMYHDDDASSPYQPRRHFHLPYKVTGVYAHRQRWFDLPFQIYFI